METIKIKGKEYEVVASKNFEHNGKPRKELALRLLNGVRLYFVTIYENDTLSGVV